jgi:hypothetical protein
MSDNDITREHYNQMWAEMRRLADAWHDRHGISNRGAAGLFLQCGATFAYDTKELTLDQVLDLVRAQWVLVKKGGVRQ